MEESKYLLLHGVNCWITDDTQILTRLPTTLILEYNGQTPDGVDRSVAL